MDDDQARALGSYLREQREEHGLSQRQLAAAVGVHKTQVLRIEQGLIGSPRADLLARIAQTLELDIADVYSMAGYTHPAELPSFTPYLRAKYSDLPDDAVAQMERYFTRLARKYGTDGPARGEDEQ